MIVSVISSSFSIRGYCRTVTRPLIMSFVVMARRTVGISVTVSTSITTTRTVFTAKVRDIRPSPTKLCPLALN